MTNWENLWIRKAPGVWGRIIGKSLPTLLDFSGATVKEDALTRMGETAFPFKSEVNAEITGKHINICIPLGPNEQLYGLGLQYQSIHQRNKVRHLKVDHYGGVDNGRTHAPCPFYVSSAGYGVFVNTAQYISFYMGCTNRRDALSPPLAKDRNRDSSWNAVPSSEQVEVSIQAAEGVEIIIFGGPTALDAVRRYNLYCGGGCLPPKWGLGIWHRVPTLYNDHDVMKEADEFKEKNFPLDVIGLEPGWHSKSYPCTYEWDQERFPDPKRLCDDLLDRGIRLNLWENPYVSPDAKIYPELLPYSGSHNVWCGIVPDYTLPKAAQIFKDQHEAEHVNLGVSGYKIDECDGFDQWLWPDHAVFPSGHTAEQMRQTYGIQLQKTLTEVFRKRNRRTYGLVRASNSGGVSFPYAIYNDCYKFEEFITGLINCGFCGVLWTPEVRGAENAEEWIRRFQVVCFSPVAMLDAWASGTKPWSFPEVEDLVRAVMKLRHRFLPYLYSAFAKYYFDGIPPFRSVVLDYPIEYVKDDYKKGNLDDIQNPYEIATSKEIKDQYMMGDSLMVAPMLPGQKEREVILPLGDWFDFYTGQKAGNGEVIKANHGIDRIPLYVKDGGILPLLGHPEYDLDDKSPSIEVQCYGEKEGSFMLYDDDGESYDFEKGAYNLTELVSCRGADGSARGRVIHKKGERPLSYKKIIFTHILEDLH